MGNLIIVYKFSNSEIRSFPFLAVQAMKRERKKKIKIRKGNKKQSGKEKNDVQSKRHQIAESKAM